MLNAYSNINGMIAKNRLDANQNVLELHNRRIASGVKVNTAYDDASGMAVGNGLTSKINSNDMALRNANDAVSMVQTAEGVVSQMIQNFQRIRELSIQSINDVKSDAARQNTIQTEVDGLTTEIVHMAKYTEFNGKSLLLGGSDLTFTVGANSSKSSQISFKASALENKLDLSTDARGNANYKVDVGTRANAEQALADVTTMLEFLNQERTRYGGVLNRMEASINPLLKYNGELKASRSRIMDADMAQETASLTRAQILQQASLQGVTTLNKVPESIGTLLK